MNCIRLFPEDVGAVEAMNCIRLFPEDVGAVEVQLIVFVCFLRMLVL